ncbi:MAG: TadE/TadG family type IV pilus assembly protein [Pirellulales bacterium]|jgi:Flp pilus assembly protein TadG
MKAFQTTRTVSQKHARCGAAAVEFALVAPLLVILVLGSIDVGQFINPSQVLNGASREGARHASSSDVTNTSEVESAVQEFLADGYPSVSSSDLNAALTVNVFDSSGSSISGSGLSSVASGDSVSVQVIFQYQAVRTISGFSGINGSSIATTTVMRRE